MMYSIIDKSTNMKIQSSTRYVTGYVQRFRTDTTAVSDRLARRTRFHRHPWAHNMLGTSRTASAVAPMPGTCTETHTHARNTPATTSLDARYDVLNRGSTHVAPATVSIIRGFPHRRTARY